MTPFTKILVPVDFSEHSKRALAVAADLARRYEASLGLVHVFQPVLYSVPESYMVYTQDQLPNLLAELEKLLEQAKHDVLAAGALQVTTAVLQGIPHVEVIRAAQEGKYDLIVMGTHGRTGMAHALLGSVAEKVVRKAPCPVLTVRTPEGKAS